MLFSNYYRKFSDLQSNTASQVRPENDCAQVLSIQPGRTRGTAEYSKRMVYQVCRVIRNKAVIVAKGAVNKY